VLSDYDDDDNMEEFLEPGFKLDSPDADTIINFGTAAPNCQPKHTTTQLQQEQEEGQEVSASPATMNDNDASLEKLQDSGSGGGPSSAAAAGGLNHGQLTAKHRRDSSNLSSDDERRKRQHLAAQQQQQQKKLSYIQMAKLGYQELVNAIIRPPRADYKVRFENTQKRIGKRKPVPTHNHTLSLTPPLLLLLSLLSHTFN
jgi:hypothetical protein